MESLKIGTLVFFVRFCFVLENKILFSRKVLKELILEFRHGSISGL